MTGESLYKCRSLSLLAQNGSKHLCFDIYRPLELVASLSRCWLGRTHPYESFTDRLLTILRHVVDLFNVSSEEASVIVASIFRFPASFKPNQPYGAFLKYDPVHCKMITFRNRAPVTFSWEYQVRKREIHLNHMREWYPKIDKFVPQNAFALAQSHVHWYHCPRKTAKASPAIRYYTTVLPNTFQSTSPYSVIRLLGHVDSRRGLVIIGVR